MSDLDHDLDRPMPASRRELLKRALFGAGMWGLRSLATGIPVAVLANPRKALAQSCPAPGKAQFLIFSTSSNGDPMNGNVPGTYGNASIVHPSDPAMAPTSMTLGGKSYTAALPWTTLAPSTLARTTFFHHGTYTVVHPDEHKVLALMGNTYGGEMLVSLLSQQLAPCLGTIQKEPVAVANGGASETIFYQGRPQPMLNPTALATVLTAPSGPLANLQALRDADLNRLNDFFKAHGNTAQRGFIDRYATSQSQARAISQNLLSTLASLTDNSPDSQVTAAIVLIQMKVSPVVTVHIPFGGDNHNDVGLAAETTQHASAIATINNMMTQLQAAGLEDQVSFLAMNVFGRTMNVARKGDNGRDHHGDHHCAVLIGKPFASSVIGGVEAANNDFRATSIDSSTGAAVAGGAGDVPFGETLGSMAKTVGVGLGVDGTFLDQNISTGKAIGPALSGA